MYEKITDALRRSATQEALTEAQELVNLHPEDALAYRWLAAAQQQGGDLDASLASIDQAIALSPDNASLHLARGAILLGTRRVDAAQLALAEASGLDPNQFGAYVLQAQVALGRGDLEEAGRLHQLASRVAPEHPHLLAIEGMLALHRGDSEKALKTITAGLKTAPEDLLLHHSLGFVYLQKGHWAFAEQAFRGVMERSPSLKSLRGLIADLLRLQDRPAEALEMLEPLLQDPAVATPALQRFAGQLQLAAGRPEAAMPLLLSALAAMPDDRATLHTLVALWQTSDQVAAGRNALDAALATVPNALNLWMARLALEPADSELALPLTTRWISVMPESAEALEAHMIANAATGNRQEAESTARRIIEISPGHSSAQAYLYGALLARDPDAAVAHAQSLLGQARTVESRQELLNWLAMAQDRAGQYAEAVASWCSRAEIEAPNQLPLHTVSPAEQPWPPLAQALHAGASHPVMLWGPPGSGVERVALLLGRVGAPLLADRFRSDAFGDGFQQFSSIDGLISGNQSGATTVSEWRSRLPLRGVDDGNAIDWLVWWDNAFLMALRPYLPEGRLLVVLRDPRDMLLEWLAFGSPSQLVFRSPRVAARWLADMLTQIAALHELQLYPHGILRLDGIENDPQAIAGVIGEALGGITMPVPDGVGPVYLASGRWRDYAAALAEPFAILAPVSQRLGYPPR